MTSFQYYILNLFHFRGILYFKVLFVLSVGLSIPETQAILMLDMYCFFHICYILSNLFIGYFPQRFCDYLKSFLNAINAFADLSSPLFLASLSISLTSLALQFLL